MNQQDGTSSLPSDNDTISMTHDMLRVALPASQPQEGSPANTFTDSELQELQAALPGLNIRPRSSDKTADSHNNSDGSKDTSSKKNNVLDICGPWEAPDTVDTASAKKEPPSTLACAASASPQEAPTASSTTPALDWHGAPVFDPLTVQSPRDFRDMVRQGKFTGPTNAICPGFLQCNLVVLPAGQHAFDFLLFCQRNPKACPLLEVCDTGSAVPLSLAPTADLRTDVPK